MSTTKTPREERAATEVVLLLAVCFGCAKLVCTEFHSVRSSPTMRGTGRRLGKGGKVHMFFSKEND